MESKKVAMPLQELLMRAIQDHERTHFGYLPKRFVLHPAVVARLKAEAQLYLLEPLPNFGVKFAGIPVESDPAATQPKLISAKNEVIFL